MSPKHILRLVALLACTTVSHAQTPSAPTNAHKAHDQKARDCRKAAADLQLSGEALRAFVANCITPPKPATH